MLKIITLIIMLLVPAKVCAEEISAESGILINAETRQVLYENNSDARLGIASTTKIMTALIALEAGNTTDVYTVSEYAQNQEGSSIYLRTGEKVSLSDLLYGLMLNSGNDAAVAIAEGVGESCENFVAMMNEKAKAIGCKNTHFVNPNGLSDPEHYSTAYDMALIMAYAMENDEFKKITSTKNYKITTESAETYLRNHNKLLWRYPYCTGGKTGFTKSDGRCFVSAAEKDGKRLVAITLDAPDDWNDHIKLYDSGFERLEKISAISENEILCTRKISGVRVNVLAGESLEIATDGGSRRGISCKVNFNAAVNGDILYGTQIGYADIYAEKFYVGSIPLVSGQRIEKKERFFDSFRQIIDAVVFN